MDRGPNVIPHASHVKGDTCSTSNWDSFASLNDDTPKPDCRMLALCLEHSFNSLTRVEEEFPASIKTGLAGVARAIRALFAKHHSYSQFVWLIGKTRRVMHGLPRL